MTFELSLIGELPIVHRRDLPSPILIAMLLLEPFYVRPALRCTLNRRAELEAWDIEQEFRRAFAQ